MTNLEILAGVSSRQISNTLYKAFNAFLSLGGGLILQLKPDICIYRLEILSKRWSISKLVGRFLQKTA